MRTFADSGVQDGLFLPVWEADTLLILLKVRVVVDDGRSSPHEKRVIASRCKRPCAS
jgi:hypothetical protein